MKPYYDHELGYRRIADAGGTGWDDCPSLPTTGPQGSYDALEGFLAGPHAPSTAVVLDLGCGGGQAAFRLARRGYQVIGIDFAPTAIELARANANTFATELANAPRFEPAHASAHSVAIVPETAVALDKPAASGFATEPPHANPQRFATEPTRTNARSIAIEPEAASSDGIAIEFGPPTASPPNAPEGRVATVPEFIVGDCLTLPFPDASFDLAIDNHVLHCLLGDDRARFLREVGRVLRPGGMLFSDTMSREGDFDPPLLHCDPATFISTRGNRYWTSEPELDALLARCGFDVLSRSRRSSEPGVGDGLISVARIRSSPATV